MCSSKLSGDHRESSEEGLHIFEEVFAVSETEDQDLMVSVPAFMFIYALHQHSYV